MDELALLAEMRSEVPGDTRYPDAQRTLMAEIGGRTAQRKKSRKPLMVIGGGLLAGAVAAGTFVALDSGDSRHAPPPRAVASTPKVRLMAVTSPTALAYNATALAQNSPIPTADQWIYQKLETTISRARPSGAMPQVPGSHTYWEKWDRVDLSQHAHIQNGKLVTPPPPRHGGQTVPQGWPPKAITYAYLNSLPTDPVKLLAVLKQNGNVEVSDIFTAIIALMTYYPLPAKLNAAFYGVLARLKPVHLGHVTDLAGRHVLSLDYVDQGLKTSLLVNPTTYTYAGQQAMVVADGALHMRKGVLLNDQAVLVSKIVDQPGER